MKNIVTKILTKYNGAFGYNKAVLESAGIPAILLLVWSIWGLFSNTMPKEAAIGFLLAGLIVLAIAVLVVLHTLSKCPPDRKNVVVLLFNMVAVAFLGGFIRHNRTFFKGVFAIIETTSTGSGSSGFAKQYIRNGDGTYCHLHSDNGTYAYLNCSGSLIEVRPHGSDGQVCDNAGNLYSPC